MGERRPERLLEIVKEIEEVRTSGGGRAIMREVYRSESKVLDLLRVREKLINNLLFPLL